MDTLLALKFPIGKYQPPADITPQQLEFWIDQVETLPARLEELIEEVTDQQLDTPYRPGGWTVRQVIHHIADSHTNSYIRFKWALTEDNPTIKAYDEASWAELTDTKNQPIDVSVQYLKHLHVKLGSLFRSLSTEQLSRTFTHPESGDVISLDWNIGMYAWHGEHHLAHVKLVVK